MFSKLRRFASAALLVRRRPRLGQLDRGRWNCDRAAHPRDVENEGDFTLPTLTVVEAPKSDASHATGTSVVVRQIRSSATPGPADLLTPGKTYLLYLTPSGLSEDLASHFYVTGGAAGLYEAVGVPKTNQRSATSAVTNSTKFAHTKAN